VLCVTKPSTKYLLSSIAVTLITLPIAPPLVVPFKVITSLVAAGTKTLFAAVVAFVLATVIAPINLSVPSVLMSKSVAAVSRTNV